MKAIKRVISMAIVAIMLVSLFAGCAGGNGDLITITVFSELANYSGIQNGWSAALFEDKFGVRLNIVPGLEGVLDTRVESGNLGDIVVWGSDGENYQNAVNLGLLYDWEEDGLVDEYGPYIKENMNNALETNREISGDGTTVYGFGHNVAPSAESHEPFFYTWDIRWDLYKELGYPEIKNWDDLVTVLGQMQALEPIDEAGEDTYAVSLWPDWDGNMVMYVKAMATAYYGYDELGIGLYDSNSGKFYGALEPDGPYLTSLKFFNNLYQNGLVDPDSMTQTYDEMSEKLKNGGVFFSIFDYAGSATFNTEEHLAQGKYMGTLVPSEASAPAYGMSTAGGNRIWSIGAKTEYPELCMEIINYLSTPQGAMAIWYGIEGLNWVYNDEGYLEFTELGLQTNSNPKFDMSGITWTSEETGKSYELSGNFNDGMIQINNVTWSIGAENIESPHGETYDYTTWKTQQDNDLSDIELDWVNHMGFDNIDAYLETTDYTVIPPAVGYSESIREGELKVTWEQVTDCITTYSWKAIYAKSDAEFDYYVDEMIRKCEAYGYADCLQWSEDEAALKFSLQ